MRAVWALLRALRFLADYPPVVARGAEVELLAGVRRPARRALSPATQLPDGVALLDGGGVPVLLLAPLAVVAAPSPGSPEELFLLSGGGPGGVARFVAHPTGFRRDDDQVWEWLSHLLPGDEDAQDAGAPGGRPPYRALDPFGPEDADLFFGREREITELVNRLRTVPLLAVVGPSGAGKTSFVCAGVIPALPDGWRAIVVRPGPRPCATLWARLGVPLDGPPELLGRALGAGDGVTVLVVDQLEELLTLTPEPAERERYVRALTSAVHERARVLLTLRDDFLLAAHQLPGMRERLAGALHLLATPAPEELRRILIEPARRAGYAFDDPELPAEMIAAVGGKPAALALLSFTAAALWDLRDRHFRRLPRRAYQAMGGVGGALAGHAERVLSRMTPDEQRLTRAAFRALVTADGTRAVLARDDLQELLESPRAAGVTEALIGARLLTAREDERGQEVVEIAHEALLSAWPRLADWRREDAEGARLRDRLRLAARDWNERGRPRGLLWRDDALVDYQRWRARAPTALTAVEGAFAATSVAAAARGRRARRGLAAAAFAVLLGAAAALAVSSHRAATEKRRADARLAEQLEERGRLALLAGKPSEAFAYLAEARRLGVDGPAARFLIEQAARPHEALRAMLGPHAGRVHAARFSPDGALVATGCDDGVVRLFDARTAVMVGALAAHAGPVYLLEFSRDGRLLASVGGDATVRLWDVATRRQRHAIIYLKHPEWEHPTIALSVDGTRLVTSGEVHGSTVWDTATGAAIARLYRGPGPAARGRAGLSPDGRRVVASGPGGKAQVFDATTGALLLELTGHADLVSSTAFSPDGTRILTGSRDGTAALWDAGTGARLRIFAGHADAVTAAFAPDGRTVLTTSRDTTARLWEAATGRLRAALESQDAMLASAFDAGGARLVIAGNQAVRAWDTRAGVLLASFAGHSGIVSDVSLSPDGGRLVTAGWDGTARLWDATATNLARTHGGHHGGVSVVRFAPGDGSLLTAGEDGHARLIDAATGSVRLLLAAEGGASIYRAAITGDGARIATAADDGIRLWDGSSGRLVRRLGSVRSTCVDFDREGRLLAAVRQDHSVRVFDASTGAERLRLDVDAVCARFDPSGRALAIAAYSGNTLIVDARTGQVRLELESRAGTVDAQFSHDGTRLVTAHRDGRTRLWRAADGAALGELPGHTQLVLVATFDPSDTFLLTLSSDRSGRVWDARDLRLLAVFPAGAAAWGDGAWSHDGRLVATPTPHGEVRLWDFQVAPRDQADLEWLARCRVPLSVHDGHLLSTPPRSRGCLEVPPARGSCPSGASPACPSRGQPLVQVADGP